MAARAPLTTPPVPTAVAPSPAVGTSSATGTSPPSALAALAEARQKVVRNEILLTLGITLLFALVGFAWAFWRNSQARSKGLNPWRTDLEAAAEGALAGVIISLLTILIYRIFVHSSTAAQERRLTSILNTAQQQQLVAQQQATLGQYGPMLSPANIGAVRNVLTAAPEYAVLPIVPGTAAAPATTAAVRPLPI